MKGGNALRRAALILLALVWGFAFLGSRPLADPDEGRYAEAAREMLQSGDLIRPTLANHPHLTKSALTYWGSAAGLLLVGHDEWGARAATGLLASIWLIATWWAGREMYRSEPIGWWSAALLAGSGLAQVGGSTLTADPPLAAFSALAVAAFGTALSDQTRRQRAVCCFWLLLGLAFFAKGPPAMLILPGVFISWSQRRSASSTDRLFPLWPMLGALAIALWWYAAMVILEPGALSLFFKQELYERILTGDLRRNNPFWLPAGILLAGLVPWLPLAVWPQRRKRAGVADQLSVGPRRLLHGWLWSGVLVFTLSQSRQPLYVLQLLTPAVLLGAGRVARLAALSVWWRRALVGLTLASILFWIGVRGVGEGVPGYRHSRDLAMTIRALHRPGDGPAVLLQSRFLPGLAFYLEELPLTVAITKADQAQPHDLSGDRLNSLIEASGGVIAVGSASGFQRLGPGFLVTRSSIDRATGLTVARLARSAEGDQIGP